MKNKLNLILLISFLGVITLNFWLNSQVTNKVGSISSDSEKDSSTFKVCDANRIVEHYSVKSSYQGGKKKIKKELWYQISPLTFNNSGTITFRFIINCKGEIGRFRIKTIDNKLTKNSFDAQSIKALQTTILTLQNWNAGTWKDKNLDSYYMLNFKVENGKITDIF